MDTNFFFFFGWGVWFKICEPFGILDFFFLPNASVEPFSRQFLCIDLSADKEKARLMKGLEGEHINPKKLVQPMPGK